MAYDLTGKVKLIQPVQTFGSGFTKREMVVIVQDGKYPQEINLEFVQDKVGLLDNLQVGQEITVTFDIRGREYNGRYFNNLQGWKIATSKVETAFSPEGQSSARPEIAPPDYDENDIPF
mgnify:CR=1 FL=1